KKRRTAPEARRKRERRDREQDEEEIPYATLAEEQDAAPPLAFAPSTGIVAELPSPSTTPLPPKAANKLRKDEPADDPSACVGERTYRVYVLPEEVYFIDDGPGDVEPTGSLLGTVFREERRTKPDAHRKLGERPTADDLFALADGEVNFRLKSADVWQAQIE